MAKSPAGTSRPVVATALGMAAAIAVLAAHLGGLGGGVERQTLDWRFRHFSNAPPQTDIVHIEIDDASLERYGRWPWPRRKLSRMVEILQQCGARAVALDIIMPEPQETRYASAAEQIYSGDIAELIGDAPPGRIFDDDALAAMLGKYDNVTLPMHIHWRSGDAIAANPLAAKIADLLGRKPEMSFKALRRSLDPNLSPGEARPEWAKLYLRQRALGAIKRLSIDPQAIGGFSARPGDLVPPLVRFAMEIKRTGFVSFVPDADGVARRIPLLARSGGRIYPQFALSLAADKLGAVREGGYSITADASAVTIRCSDGRQIAIPVDDEGFMLINWTPRRKETRVSASAVAAIVQLRDDIEQAGRLIRHYQIALLKLIYPGEYLGQVTAARLLAEADRLYEMQVAAQVRRQRAALYDPANVPPPSTSLQQQSRLIEAEIDRAFAEELEDLRDPELFESSLGPPPAPTTGPADEAAASDYPRRLAQYEARKAALTNLMGQLDRLPRVQQAKQAEIADLLTRLRRRVAAKTAIIGSTATGAADFVPTPLHPRTPGIVVHSNIFNPIINAAFVTGCSG